MKFLYVAKHDSGDNDDEGAIAFALRAEGHEVVQVHEIRRHRAGIELTRCQADVCLFHKWETVSELAQVAANMPCAFWYFDMVANDDDPSLSRRMAVRRRWFADVLPYCVLGFCTDGDWVARDGTGKLRWLMQGADERTAGFGERNGVGVIDDVPDILFTGMIDHGQERAAHVAHLQARWGERFGVIGARGPLKRVHGRELADTFASARIVVAPDGPNTARYWSNRIYLTLGLGGFLLHPYCAGIVELGHYSSAEVEFYRDWESLDRRISRFLDYPEAREARRTTGHYATLARNLYRHRVRVLVAELRKAGVSG